MPDPQQSQEETESTKIKNHKQDHTCTCDIQKNSEICTTCKLDEDNCDSCAHNHVYSQSKTNWTNTIIIGLAIVTGMFLDYFSVGGPLSTVILVVAMVASGHKMAINGFKEILKKNIGIDFLVTIAAIGATLIGQYSEGALVVFLKDISLKLELIASEKARHAIEALMELRPEVATIKREEEEITVSVDQVKPGEVFIVRPGDRIPLDGFVINGETTVDQSAMTGESIPIVKGYEDEIYAGTINLDGYLEVETSKTSTESVLSNILQMVQEAEGKRRST